MNRITQWFYGLGSALISGSAAGAAATIGVAAAAIPGYVLPPTLGQAGASVAGGAILGLAAFLKSNPLPPLNKP